MNSEISDNPVPIRSEISNNPVPVHQDKTISLRKAILILVAVAGLVVITGCIIGYAFFWGQYRQQNYGDIVFQAAQERVKTNPKSATAHLELGYAYLLRREEDEAFVDKALKELQLAYRLDPDNRQVQYNLALGYIADRQYTEAIELLVPLAEEGIFDLDAHFSLGEAYYLNGQFAEAIRVFSEAAAIRPGISDIYYYMALSHEKAGDREKALIAVDKALSLAPDYEVYLELKARLTEQPPGGGNRES